MSDPGASDGPAWQFVTEVYGRPGVAAACLELQEQGGVDVVLLLVAGYAGRCGIALDAASLDRLDDRIAEWRARIVRPLRAVRRTLKHLDLDGVGTQSLRQDVQRVELAAERLELAALLQAFPPPAGVGINPVLDQLEAVARRSSVLDPHLEAQVGVIAAAMETVAV